jgi:membrane protein DedA with SNARE-associated domain
MPASLTHAVIIFIQENAFWAGPAAFALSLAASVLGPSFFIPASLILVGVGVTVGAGLVSWSIVLWAAGGAILGSTASYAIGIFLGPRMRQVWPLKHREHMVERASALFHRHGFAAILIGYFSGPLRAPVAFMAGMAGMGPLPFQFANLGSAALWAPFVVGEGAILGAALGVDHPLFLVAPLVAPLLALLILTGVATLWRSRRKRRSPGDASA